MMCDDYFTYILSYPTYLSSNGGNMNNECLVQIIFDSYCINESGDGVVFGCETNFFHAI